MIKTADIQTSAHGIQPVFAARDMAGNEHLVSAMHFSPKKNWTHCRGDPLPTIDVKAYAGNRSPSDFTPPIYFLTDDLCGPDHAQRSRDWYRVWNSLVPDREKYLRVPSTLEMI